VVTICVEMAQAMGASHEQILGSIHSAVNAQTSRSWRGDGAVRGLPCCGRGSTRRSRLPLFRPGTTPAGRRRGPSRRSSSCPGAVSS
jgi:hypothetical protein